MKRIIISATCLVRVLTVVLVLITLAFASACQSVRNANLNYQESRSGEYHEILKQWTSKAGVYRGFETMLLAEGTYKSSAFRRAYVKKYAKDYRLDAKAEAEMLKAELSMAEGEVEFVLAVYASDRERLRLSAKDSLWRIYLEGAGEEPIIPFEIRSLKKKRTSLEEFFPYITPWVEIYQVRFKVKPSAETPQPLHLVLTGVLGTAKLTF